jgi:hypothetical protein
METATAGNAPVRHYFAHLELPTNNTIFDLSGDDLGVVKEQLQAIMKGGCRFEPLGNSTQIFHPTIDGGKRSLGWIGSAGIDLPGHMTNKAWMARRETVAA